MIRLMVGRDIDDRGASPRHADGAPTRGAALFPSRRAANPAVSAARRVVRRRPRRDSRHGRSGRRRPVRGRAGDLRHRARGRRNRSASADAPLRSPTPASAIRHGVFLVPEDRRSPGSWWTSRFARTCRCRRSADTRAHGLVSERARSGNVSARLPAAAGQGAVDRGQGRDLERRQPAEGGARQVARARAERADRRRADARHRRRRQGGNLPAAAGLAREGVSIVMISSDMEEILQLSDRVAVMHEGRVTGILERADCTEQRIMTLAVGQAGRVRSLIRSYEPNRPDRAPPPENSPRTRTRPRPVSSAYRRAMSRTAFRAPASAEHRHRSAAAAARDLRAVDSGSGPASRASATSRSVPSEPRPHAE